jgi:hypothetical protein
MIFSSLFGPLLIFEVSVIFEAAEAVVKIGSSLKSNHLKPSLTKKAYPNL